MLLYIYLYVIVVVDVYHLRVKCRKGFKAKGYLTPEVGVLLFLLSINYINAFLLYNFYFNDYALTLNLNII